MATVLVNESKFSPAAESTKIAPQQLFPTPINNVRGTSMSFTCVTPMTPGRTNYFMVSETSTEASSNDSEIDCSASYVDETIISDAPSREDAQCVPCIVKEDIMTREIEGCEAEESYYVSKTFGRKPQPLASSTMIYPKPITTMIHGQPLASSTMIASTAQPKLTKRSSKPRASSTMIEYLEPEPSAEGSGSVCTWSIDESSELILLEDTYMRKMNKKLIPLFGNPMKKNFVGFRSATINETTINDTLKYEDGRCSDLLSERKGRLPVTKKSGIPRTSTTVDLKSQKPCTSRECQRVPDSEDELSDDDAEFIPLYERPEVPGEEFPDASRVTPDNPSIEIVVKKPMKIKKFNHGFKLRRTKGLASLNTETIQTDSPAKKELFSRQNIGTETRPKGISVDKKNIMRKLRRFGESFRLHGKAQFKSPCRAMTLMKCNAQISA